MSEGEDMRAGAEGYSSIPITEKDLCGRHCWLTLESAHTAADCTRWQMIRLKCWLR